MDVRTLTCTIVNNGALLGCVTNFFLVFLFFRQTKRVEKAGRSASKHSS